MELIRASLSSEIVSATQSSVWMAQVEFVRSDTAAGPAAAVCVKNKYNLLRPGGQQVNGVPKSAVVLNKHSTCKSDLPVNGFVPKDSTFDEIPTPKIRIESADAVSLDWRKMSAIGAGLMNLGNTCFMNSVLQCLTYCPPLVNYLMFRENEHSKNLCSNFCMACELLANMRRCFQSPGGVVKPLPIAQRLKSVARHFQLGRQEDAHEYLRHAIDSMCKSSVSAYENRHPPVKLDAASKETTAFNHIFGGYLRSQVTCLDCKSRSNTFDHFMDLMLDVKSVTSVEKALEKFTKPEHLQNENAYKCPKCKKKGQATKRFSVHRPPNVVTIQLKRFEFNRFSGKITKHIHFPEFLNLRPYMSDPTGANLMYRLNAVLVHSGATCNSGHYYSYVRNSNNCWFRMDDERVTSAGLQHVLNQNAYILFYIKRAGESKSLSNGSATTLNPAAIRSPTPVPPFSKVMHSSLKITDSLPRPFAESNTPHRNSLLVPNVTSASVKEPKLICEPAAKKPVTTNGTTSNHVTSNTAKAVARSDHVNKSAATNLVPYSSDSSSDDEEAIPQKKFSNGTVTTIGSHNNGTVKGDRIISDTSMPAEHSSAGLTNGSKRSYESSFDLMRLGNQTLQSFGSSVTGWDGGQNRLDQHLERDKKAATAMDEEETYNQEYDRGKVKKVKSVKLDHKPDQQNGKNAFDLFRQDRAKPDVGPKNSFLDRGGSHQRWRSRFPGRGGWKRRQRHEYR